MSRPLDASAISRAIHSIEARLRALSASDPAVEEWASTAPPIQDAAPVLQSGDWNGWFFPVALTGDLDLEFVVLRVAGFPAEPPPAAGRLWIHLFEEDSQTEFSGTVVHPVTSANSWMPYVEMVPIDETTYTYRAQLREPIRLSGRRKPWILIRRDTDHLRAVCYSGECSRARKIGPGWDPATDPPRVLSLVPEAGPVAPAVALLSRAGYRRRYP